MGQIIHKTGDIFTTEAKAIGHGVNTKGLMGAGIAKQFRDRLPNMYQEYKDICAEGNFKGGMTVAYDLPGGYVVYNIASQEEPGANASYDFLTTGVDAALRDAEDRGISAVALPRIGSGIGGLDEAEVENILAMLALFYNVDIELWTYQA